MNGLDEKFVVVGVSDGSKGFSTKDTFLCYDENKSKSSCFDNQDIAYKIRDELKGLFAHVDYQVYKLTKV